MLFLIVQSNPNDPIIELTNDFTNNNNILNIEGITNCNLDIEGEFSDPQNTLPMTTTDIEVSL